MEKTNNQLKTNLVGKFKLRVYQGNDNGKAFTSFSLQISTKTKDGEWNHCYVPVNFTENSGCKKWTPGKSQYWITLQEAWPAAKHKAKDGNDFLVIVINKCKIEPVEEKVIENIADDLPF